MKKIIVIISTLILFFQFQGNTQIVIENGETIDCQELMNKLFIYKTVCLVKKNQGNFPYKIFVGCDLVIGQGQELIVPAVTDIVLNSENADGSASFGSITLTGGGKLTGEHFETSKVVMTEDNAVAITMNDSTPCVDDEGNTVACPGNEITNIMITAPDADNATGLVIDVGSEENELSEVKFRELENGMVVDGDNNTFTDLQFFMVAIDSDDCDANENDPAAIRLNQSSGNNFTNIFHNRSVGAITLYMHDTCNNNTILNMSVEQEEDDDGNNCISEKDPSLYIDDINITDNIITCNFNHGKTITADDTNNNSTICSNNNISDLGCMNTVILNCDIYTN